MTNLHKIRARIRSVNSTQQITRTMKMIAVSKLRKTQTSLAGVRLFADKSQAVLNALLAGEPAREHRIVLELLRILALELAEVALYERIYSNALVVGIEYRRGVGAALERTRYDRADGRIDKLRAHILELFSALFAELNVGVTDIFSLGLLLCRAASYDIDYIAFHVSSKNTLSILLNCMIENS